MRQERGEATHYATASVLAAGVERLHTLPHEEKLSSQCGCDFTKS